MDGHVELKLATSTVPSRGGDGEYLTIGGNGD